MRYKSLSIILALVIGVFCFTHNSKAVVRNEIPLNPTGYSETRTFPNALQYDAEIFSPQTDYFVNSLRIYCAATGSLTGTHVYLKIVDTSPTTTLPLIDGQHDHFSYTLTPSDCTGDITIHPEISPQLLSTQRYALVFYTDMSNWCGGACGYYLGMNISRDDLNYCGTPGNWVFCNGSGNFPHTDEHISYVLADNYPAPTFFSIDTPFASTQNPVVLGGSCNATSTLDITLDDEDPYDASNAEGRRASPFCLNNRWTWNQVPSLHTGTWFARGTGTNPLSETGYDHDFITFFVATGTATSTNPIPISPLAFTFSLTCQIPYFNYDPCAALSTLLNNFKQGLYSWTIGAVIKLGNVKPYAYIPQVVSAFRQGVQNESSTSTLPVASVTISTTTDSYFHPTIVLFQASTLTSILSQNTWDTIRPYAVIALYLVFLNYLWFRFIHL